MTKDIIQLDSNLDFSNLSPEQLKNTVDYFIEKVQNKVYEITQMSKEDITWENSMKELDHLEQQFSRVLSIVSHLTGVTENKPLDKAYEECIPKLVEHSSKIGQNKDLMIALEYLKDKELNDVQKKVLEDELKSFKHAGIDLSEEKQKELNQINERLQILGNTFKNNITDTVSEYSMEVTAEELEGVPESLLSIFKEFATAEEKENYVVKLIAPYHFEVMKYLKNREMRKKIHKASATVASKELIEKYDNEPILNEIVKLKTQKAKILGYDNYVEFSLSKKMANSYEEILELLNNLKDRTKEKSKEELKMLSDYAMEKDGLEDFNVWDVAYYAESYKSEKYNISGEEIKEYFPLEKAKSGLFYLIEKMYGVTFKLREGDNLYNDDLFYYDLYKGEEKVASLLMDLFARKGKQGGAWMSDYQNKFAYKETMDLPVAFVVCNFPKETENKPSLLSFDEVRTLFHEMGHALHHMLTEVDELGVAGISGVVWDAVELPSQFMEYFCIQPEILEHISGHYKTGETISLELIEKLKQEENYLNAMGTMRQVELSIADLDIHKYHEELPYSVLAKVKQETSVIQSPEYDRFLNKFGHIFAGGYSAGYYSYKWADVLSADVFESFEENGVFCKKTASKFLNTLLSKGGSGDISEMFKAFKGRNPDIEAYLRYNNLN